MFPFLNNVIETFTPKKNKSNAFEPILIKNARLQTPNEIRKTIKNLLRCGSCHFLVFDNYWSNEIQQSNIKLCPTCGNKM